MKRLILFFLLPVLACGGSDHEHNLVLPGFIDDSYTATIVDIQPPVHGEGTAVKRGRLEADGNIIIDFSRRPHGLTVTNVPRSIGRIRRPAIPVDRWYLLDHRLTLYAPCSEITDDGGEVSFELRWCSGDNWISTASLTFSCFRKE